MTLASLVPKLATPKARTAYNVHENAVRIAAALKLPGMGLGPLCYSGLAPPPPSPQVNDHQAMFAADAEAMFESQVID